MFCPKCGSEIIEEANFCPDCGAKLKFESAVGTQNQTQGPDALAAEAQETPNQKKTASLKKTVKHSLKLSHRAARTIVLITLVLALGSSIAYAAFYVYQNVYLPSQQEQTVQENNADNKPEYDVETESLTVSVPYPIYYNDPSLKEDRRDERWNYDILTCSEDNEAVGKINAAIRKSIKKTAKDTEKQDGELEECVLDREIRVTKISEEYVCLLDVSHATNGGNETWYVRQSVYFDLNTGESISPSEALKIPESELTKMGKKAMKAYLKDNPTGNFMDPSGISLMEQEDIDEAVEQVSAKAEKNDLGLVSNFLSTDLGLVYVSGYGALRYSYEYANIVIKPSTKKYKVGESIEKDSSLCLSSNKKEDTN